MAEAARIREQLRKPQKKEELPTAARGAKGCGERFYSFLEFVEYLPSGPQSGLLTTAAQTTQQYTH